MKIIRILGGVTYLIISRYTLSLLIDSSFITRRYSYAVIIVIITTCYLLPLLIIISNFITSIINIIVALVGVIVRYIYRMFLLFILIFF